MIGPHFIVVTGIDGSGKTTQAKLLVDQLESEGFDVTYEHSIGPNFEITREVKDLVAKNSLEKEDEIVNNTELRSPTKLFGIFFLIRGVWQAWMNKITNSTTDVVVLDRYLYDDLVRVMWKYEYPLSYLTPLTRFAPSPSIVFCLETPSEIAWQREIDGQTSKSEHDDKKNCYDSVISTVEGNAPLMRIDTHQFNVEETQSKIYNTISNELQFDL